MDNKYFIAELHDIGKLLSNDVKKMYDLQMKSGYSYLHTFASFDFKKYNFKKPDSLSFIGQYHHMKRRWNRQTNSIEWTEEYGTPAGAIDINDWSFVEGDIENRYYLFLLILADHLSSSLSRAYPPGRIKQTFGKKINKLWYNECIDFDAFAFKSPSDLITIFNEIENCKSGEDFLNKYTVYLKAMPEDKSFPRYITSLYTHIQLTGKIYRVLNANTEILKNADNSISIKYGSSIVKTIKEAEGIASDFSNAWKARIVKCKITFPHFFARLKDINIISERSKLIDDLKNDSLYKDTVLFSTSDYVMLFLPEEYGLDGRYSLEKIFRKFTAKGFSIEAVEIKSVLGMITSVLDREVLKDRKDKSEGLGDKRTLRKIENRLKKYNQRDIKVYFKNIGPEIRSSLKHQICDICQQEPGFDGNIYSDNDDIIKESICRGCYDIRQSGNPFPDYSQKWEKECIKVCWFKFALIPDKLEKWILDGFESFVTNSGKDPRFKGLTRRLRPVALQVDFNEDYNKMIDEFWRKFKGKEDEIRAPLGGNPELGVFKYSPLLLNDVISTYIKLIEKYFPNCVHNDNSPISLSISIANIKYPIRDHWRYFEKENKSFLNISHRSVFDESYSKEEYKEIVDKIFNSNVSSSYLHKLIGIYDKLASDILLAVEIIKNKESHGFKPVYDLYAKGIKPEKFLNLYKVIEGEVDTDEAD